jgi:hypothetical protein
LIYCKDVEMNTFVLPRDPSDIDYGYYLMLTSVLNPLRTINYSLELSYKPESQPKGPFYLNEAYKIILPRTHTVGLKIKLEGSEALEQNTTIRRMYNNQLTSDVEVHCGDLVIKAHKNVLGLHSETLRVAFSNANCIEGQTGIYRIAEEHISPDILESIIRWMYMHSIANAADKAWVCILVREKKFCCLPFLILFTFSITAVLLLI